MQTYQLGSLPFDLFKEMVTRCSDVQKTFLPFVPLLQMQADKVPFGADIFGNSHFHRNFIHLTLI
jgi:hypothetical protein